MGIVWRKTEIIDTFRMLCQYFFSSSTFFFLFATKIFHERNFFFTLRRFNSANSIFHRSRCREFNWAQGVLIFVECNMQSSDLSNQILVYAIDCTPTRRQILDKFYPLLLHSCIVISSRIVIHFHLELMKIYVRILRFCLKF